MRENEGVRAQLLVLRLGDRELLESWTRSSSIRAGLAQRARIVLLAADGVSNTEIADWLGCASHGDRLAGPVCELGGEGPEDERRSGRPRTIDRAKIPPPR